MKRLVLTILVWLLACLPLHAAEEGDTDTQEQPAPEAESGDAREPVEPLPDIGLIEEAEEREQAAQGDEDFVPSIRITEDLPVAFPADI